MSDEQIHWNHTLTLRGGAVLFQPPWVWNTLILGQIFDSSLGLAQVKVCRYINIYDSNISMPCFSWMVFVQKIYNFVFSLYIFLSEGLAKIFNFFPHFTEADKPPKRLGYLFFCPKLYKWILWAVKQDMYTNSLYYCTYLLFHGL